jgi:transmembrane sensor
MIGPSPFLDDARIARQFEGAFRRAGRIRTRRRITRASIAVALLAAMFVLFLRTPPAPTPVMPIEGASVESAMDKQTIALSDGTRIEALAGTRFEFAVARPRAVRIVLAVGELDLDVTHDPNRSFHVVCGSRTVQVMGTHFHVTYDGVRFAVSVSRGRVRVDGPEGSIEVGAGERWSHGEPRPEPPPVPVVSAPAASATNQPAPPAPRAETAAEIFNRAQSARLAGRSAEAARAYDILRTRHRTDARAGLAAFELGRIRLDDLGDPAGAADAFADAIVLAPNASYREDAEARRVEAYDRMHDTVRCKTARDDYLARYPSGVFRASVTKRCAAP